MPELNIQTAPKQFCENISIAFSQEFFVMAMLNGSTGTAYTLTPGHARRLQQYLSFQIDAYEKAHGKISGDNWDPNVKSPLKFDK